MLFILWTKIMTDTEFVSVNSGVEIVQYWITHPSEREGLLTALRDFGLENRGLVYDSLTHQIDLEEMVLFFATDDGRFDKEKIVNYLVYDCNYIINKEFRTVLQSGCRGKVAREGSVLHFHRDEFVDISSSSGVLSNALRLVGKQSLKCVIVISDQCIASMWTIGLQIFCSNIFKIFKISKQKYLPDILFLSPTRRDVPFPLDKIIKKRELTRNFIYNETQYSWNVLVKFSEEEWSRILAKLDGDKKEEVNLLRETNIILDLMLSKSDRIKRVDIFDPSNREEILKTIYTLTPFKVEDLNLEEDTVRLY